MSENAIRLLTTKKIIMAEEGTEWVTVILHAYSTHSVITSELVILEDISFYGDERSYQFHIDLFEETWVRDLREVKACVAYGGWVPRNLGARTAGPKPR